MVALNITSTYQALSESQNSFVQQPENKELQEKLARAIADNFLAHAGDVLDTLSAEEQLKQKALLLGYMRQYIIEKIDNNEPIDIHMVSDPVHIRDWIKVYSTFEKKNARETLFENKLDPSLQNASGAKVVQFSDYTQHVASKDDQIKALQAKLHATQMAGTIVNPRMRRVNLGIVDIKVPGRGDRSTRHYRTVQPLYDQYVKTKNNLTREQKLAELQAIIEYCMGFLPNAHNLVYRMKKSNFQSVIQMSKGRRDKLAELIKFDESAGKLSEYKHNRLLARKGLFNIFNEVLAEMEQLLIKDTWKKESFAMAMAA